MCRSIRRTILSLQHMITSTSHRTRLSAKIYHSITHHLVLMLIIMPHWTRKHKENSQHMTPYHHPRKIRMHRFTLILSKTCMTAVRWSCSWGLWYTELRNTEKTLNTRLFVHENNIGIATAFPLIIDFRKSFPEIISWNWLHLGFYLRLVCSNFQTVLLFKVCDMIWSDMIWCTYTYKYMHT